MKFDNATVQKAYYAVAEGQAIGQRLADDVGDCFAFDEQVFNNFWDALEEVYSSPSTALFIDVVSGMFAKLYTDVPVALANYRDSSPISKLFCFSVLMSYNEASFWLSMEA